MPKRDFWIIVSNFEKNSLFTILSFSETPQYTRKIGNKKGPFSKVLLNGGDGGSRTRVRCGYKLTSTSVVTYYLDFVRKVTKPNQSQRLFNGSLTSNG